MKWQPIEGTDPLPESEELYRRMILAAIELCRMNEFGALHIFVADGNCEDEHIEFCLEQPEITAEEMEFAQRMRYDFTEEQRFGVWAFAQCNDILERSMRP